MTNKKGTILVMGGGISGLVKAWKLKQNGYQVTLLESGEKTGGAMQTTIQDGFLAESGPNSLLINDWDLAEFFNEIGLKNEIVESNKEAKKRYLYRNGNPVAAPASPFGLIGTPLYSASGKWRLLKEPFIKSRDSELTDESLASFVRRRMGREFLDYTVSPFVSGIYAGDPEKLSVRYGFFSFLWDAEAKGGSVLKGAFKLMKEKKKARTRERFKRKMISFRHGLETLPRRLTELLGPGVETKTVIQSIVQVKGGQWQVEWRSAQKENDHVELFDRVISALPAHQISALPWPESLKTRLTDFDTIEHPPVTTFSMGFRRDKVSHPLDGFGMLVPTIENRRILGTLFTSSLFPGRAPEGYIVLTTFLGGAMRLEMAELDEEAQKHVILEEIRDILGVSGDPVFSSRVHWDKAIPQYNLGYNRYLEKLDAIEEDYMNLEFCGNYRTGIAVVNCIREGLAG